MISGGRGVEEFLDRINRMDRIREGKAGDE
jgi:hypothetical protein